MTTETAPSANLAADPAFAVAERQLVMLGELAELAMEVSRVFAASAIASGQAARAVLTDKYFMPEIGRANACGAKDAAESFHKVSRTLRLTLALETATAQAVRDLRAGVIERPTAAPPARDAKAARIVIGETPEPPVAPPDADRDGEAGLVERPGRERERLVEFECADRLPRGSYCRLVEELAADIGGAIDWDSAAVSAPDLGDIVMSPPRARLATTHREMALSP